MSNNDGEVVGMVDSTRFIYISPNTKKAPNKTDKPVVNVIERGDFQKVIRNCVPVESIRALFKKG